MKWMRLWTSVETIWFQAYLPPWNKNEEIKFKASNLPATVLMEILFHQVQIKTKRNEFRIRNDPKSIHVYVSQYLRFT